MWYSGIGLCTAIVVGMLVSLITGWLDKLYFTRRINQTHLTFSEKPYLS